MLIGTSKKRGFVHLFGELRETLVELVNTTGSVNQLNLSGEVRVAEGRNFHFHQWVLFSVFPGSRFFGCGAGFAQEGIVGRNVLEHYEAIAGRMNIFFHDAILLKNGCKLEFKNSSRKSSAFQPIPPNFFKKTCN
jgi:hypothetical protein